MSREPFVINNSSRGGGGWEKTDLVRESRRFIQRFGYLCSISIPQEIRKAAAPFRRGYHGTKIIHLGKYKGDEAYYLMMPEETHTGYPPVFLLRDRKVVEIVGEQSLEIISTLMPLTESECQ